jgi:PhnB protein
MAVKPIPEGYHTLSPSISVENAAEAIEFYKRAFGATERGRMNGPDGRIAHAELQIGDSVLMLADPFPMGSTKPPTQIGGTAVTLFLYVEDADAVFKQAVDAGASSEMEPDNMFWGDRFGSVVDPYGHSWAIATHVEDVPPEEIEERGRAAMAAMSGN